MSAFFSDLFSTTGFMPHGHCFLWRPDILWLHVISDALIAACYFSIPAALLYLAAKRKDVPYRRLVLLFSAFIVACGTTHLLSIVSFWIPIYRVDGLAKLVTALVSATTVFSLIPLLPELLSLKSPQELMRINAELEAEVKDRRRAEAELRHMQDRLGALVAERTAEIELLTESVPQLIWQTSHSGHLFYTNRRLQEYTGRPMENPEWLDLVHPEDLAQTISLWTRALATGEPYQNEYRLRHASGAYRWFLARAVAEKDERGHVRKWVGTSTDIHDRKILEERLASALEEAAEAKARLSAERALFRTTLEQMPIGIVLAEAPNGKIIFANHCINQIWRQPLIPSNNIDEYGKWKGYHPDGQPYEGRDWPLARAVTQGETVVNEDTRVMRGDGTFGVLRLNATPVRNGQGEIIAGVVICEDRTEITRVEGERAELFVAERTAREASRLKSEFLANMSHEVRTPINGIVGMTQLLLDTPLTEEQREHLDTIKTSADALLNIVNDILDLSKIEAGRLEFDETDFDLHLALQEVEKAFAYAASAKGLQLTLELAADLPRFVKGDPGRLRQVLSNLLSNSIKFTEKGTVTIRARRCERRGSIERLRFEIEDSGIGIALDATARLFRPFSQADSSTTRRFGGTGLGLSICKHLVERMAGTIGVASQPERGSVFWFEVELAAGQVTAPEAPKVIPNLSTQLGYRPRILVADDNTINQKIAVKFLERMHLQAQAVGSGAEVLRALEEGISYDLVLMDCQMPEMDGFEATQRIRADARFNRLPIVAMTANALPGDRERCLEAGMDDYLAKPIHASELSQVLLKYLG